MGITKEAMAKFSSRSLAYVGLTCVLLLTGCGGGSTQNPLANGRETAAAPSLSNGSVNPSNPDPQPGSLPPPPNSKSLNVARSGSGVVTSTPAGINCSNDCVESFPADTKVTLVASPGAGYAFKGWGGACNGIGSSCTVTMSESLGVTVNFESTGPHPTSIDTVIAQMPPNSWKALPGTQMKDVCPAPFNDYLCWAVMGAWSGGDYDAVRDRMVIHGGGHNDSWYNNIFAFDLVTMRWDRLTEMPAGTSDIKPPPGWDDPRVETCGFYPKGFLTLPDSVMIGAYVAYEKCFTEPVLSQLDLQQPRSNHTYGGVFVDRINDRYCYLGAGASYITAQATSPVVACLDPKTRLWSRAADRPMTVGGRGQTALDSKGNVWSVAGEQAYIGQYDPIANSWKTYGYNNYDAGGGTDIDRKRNHLYVLFSQDGAAHSVRRWDLTSPASLTANKTYTEVATSGDKPTGLATRPGFVYADARSRFFAWGGGKDVYSFDPATAIWNRFAATGDDPGLQQKWGTYGRFRYSPSRDVFVLVNDTNQNVFIYKPAAN